ncbi:NADH-quinone oxidoreductase subunit NuoK [Aquifex pyrophilus]
MKTIPLEAFLTVSMILFGLGVIGIIARRNLLTVLMSLELALNAVNIALVGADHYLGLAEGQIFALFIIALAATEAAVGLGIIIALFRLKRAESTSEINELRG